MLTYQRKSSKQARIQRFLLKCLFLMKQVLRNYALVCKEWHPTKNHPLLQACLLKQHYSRLVEMQEWTQWKRTPDQRTRNRKVVGNCQECISIVAPRLSQSVSDKNTDKDIAEKLLNALTLFGGSARTVIHSKEK